MIKTGNRNFWIAQLIGWGSFALVNFFMQYAAIMSKNPNSETFKLVIANSAIAFIGGFIVTTGYRYFIKKRNLNLLKISTTLLYIIASTIILTLAFLAIVNLLMAVFIEMRLLTALEFFGNFFIFGILMLIWNSLYFMIHYLHSWKNAESEKWQLAASMKEAQLGSLKAQINPHFMFNAINNIRALISVDPDKAKSMLLNFSDMFRYSLVHNDNSLVRIQEELEIVNKYLELHSIQFENKLHYQINSDPLLNDRKIPPMIIQLLVENAIKHGISELPDGGIVNINVLDEGEALTIQVKNSGSLKTSSSIQKKLGVGLQNIKERLKLIYGEKTKLLLSEEGEFVVAQIRIPLTSQKS